MGVWATRPSLRQTRAHQSFPPPRAAHSIRHPTSPTDPRRPKARHTHPSTKRKKQGAGAWLMSQSRWGRARLSRVVADSDPTPHKSKRRKAESRVLVGAGLCTKNLAAPATPHAHPARAAAGSPPGTPGLWSARTAGKMQGRKAPIPRPTGGRRGRIGRRRPALWRVGEGRTGEFALTQPDDGRPPKRRRRPIRLCGRASRSSPRSWPRTEEAREAGLRAPAAPEARLRLAARRRHSRRPRSHASPTPHPRPRSPPP